MLSPANQSRITQGHAGTTRRISMCTCKSARQQQSVCAEFAWVALLLKRVQKVSKSSTKGRPACSNSAPLLIPESTKSKDATCRYAVTLAALQSRAVCLTQKRRRAVHTSDSFDVRDMGAARWGRRTPKIDEVRAIETLSAGVP
jgi:hypothetical protein